MTRSEFQNLKVGAIVRHKTLGEALIVTACYGDRVTAVRTHDLTNPSEWVLVSQAQHVTPTNHCGTFEQPPEEYR